MGRRSERGLSRVEGNAREETRAEATGISRACVRETRLVNYCYHVTRTWEETTKFRPLV